MADVNASQSTFAQVRLVARLRWQVLRNSLRRKSNRWDFIGLIISSVVASIFVLSMCVAFYGGAYAFASGTRVAWIALLFWAIFLFWQFFPVFVAGFGASFEFRTMLRFPLRLPAFYLIGLAYGLADFSAVSATLWLLSMTAGVGTARPEALPAMVVVVAIFILLNVTIERLLGSWLERLLARRRTRELFVGLFVLAMVSMNFITPFVTKHQREVRPVVEHAQPYLAFLPPSLAGKAVAGAAQGQFGATLAGFGGLLAYVGVCSALLWQRFATQYRGEELSETAAPKKRAKRAASGEKEGGDALGALPPTVSAVMRKEFRYLTRNGFTFVTLLVPPIMVLFFATQFGPGKWQLSRETKTLPPDMFFPGMMGYLILILLAPAYNAFAYESKGIQTYFTAPVRFRDILLGKNLFLLSVLFLELTVSGLVFGLRVGLPPPPRFVATLAAVAFVTIGQLAIANWSSLNFPRKLEFGQMRNQRQSGMAVLVAFGVQITLGGVSAFVLFASKWTGNVWLPAEAFVFLAVAAIAGYAASLDPLSRLAEKKQETLIEALCR